MEKHEKIKKDTYTWTARYAQKQGYVLNPDEEMLDLVVDGIAKNKATHGKNFCPCRIITGDEIEDKKIICPCIYHKQEIDELGACHCGLFFKAPEADCENDGCSKEQDRDGECSDDG